MMIWVEVFIGWAVWPGVGWGSRLTSQDLRWHGRHPM